MALHESAQKRVEAVAIGASAGGVDALVTLLQALPAAYGAAVAVVLHLPASPSTSLPRLLQRHCALPVREAEDKLPMEPGTVAIAPGGYHLLVEPDHTLSFSLDEPVHFARPSIDLLFESAAAAYGPALLAVLLTGANEDGAAGMRAVKENGGQNWVQDPSDAMVRIMPEAAIATGAVDRVLPLAQLARQLAAAAPAHGELQ